MKPGVLHVTRVSGMLLGHFLASSIFLVVLVVAGAGRDWSGADVEAYLPVLAIVPTMMIATTTFVLGARFAGAVGATFWSVLIALVVATLYQQPIIDGLGMGTSFVPGPGIFEPPFAATPTPLAMHLAPLAMCVAPLLAGVLAALARWGVAHGRARGVALACGAIGMGLVAVALAVPRWSRPSPYRYLGTLQRMGGPVEQDRPFRIGEREFRLTLLPHSPLRSPLLVRAKGPDGSPRDEGCVVAGPRGSMPIGVPLQDHGDQEGCLPLLLRVDPRGDYAVLYSACPDLCAYLPSAFSYLTGPPTDPELAEFAGTQGGQRSPYALAFRVEDGAQVLLTLDLISDRLAAPRSFVFVALGGTAVAAALLAMAALTRRRRPDLPAIAVGLEASALVAAVVLSTPLVVAHAFGV